MRKKIWLTLAVIVLVAVLMPTMLLARGFWSTGDGCFLCLPHGGGTLPDNLCWQVGNEEYGDGIHCENPYGFGMHVCILSGGACYNVVAGGGDLGGALDDYGDPDCTVPTGTACSAACSACTFY